MSLTDRGPAPARTGPHESAAADPLTPQSIGTFDTRSIARACDEGTVSRAAAWPRRPVPGHHVPLSWAEQLIASADGPVPEYGSAAWGALPDDSRAKLAAYMRAAERWRTQRRAADVLAFPGGRRAHEIAEARRPRPGDHPGGPVPVWDCDEVRS